ncbi:MAG TPA: hypothetical protein VFV61_06340 [Pyrinomonadaceae bacterium]|nr:hypothetical protein [Pyrinomonadaceae bacterium]
MLYKKLVTVFVVAIVTVAAAVASFAATSNHSDKTKGQRRVLTPVNLAILIQDDLVSQVGNELDETRDFIRSLPAGSQVMVGYITTGTLQVRQPFTTDLEKAASSLRIVTSSTSASAFNPYVEVVEALRKFESGKGKNVLLLISDGLDTSRGFDSSAAGNTLDLHRAIDNARKRDVAVYTFFAPSVGLTSHNRLAVSYGQSSLNRLANETGGKAFFQGSSFVSFSPYFRRLREALNEQYARAY